MAITKLLSTAVGGDYSFLNEMQERASSITYDQILSNIFLNRYNETELRRLYVHLRSYKERFFVEKYELVNFASTFNREFATDNNECFSVVEKLLRQIKQTMRGTMQIFKAFCKKKRHNKFDGAGRPIKLSVLTHSDLGARYTQLVIPFTEEEAVPKLLWDFCNLLMEYFVDIVDVIGICKAVRDEELMILNDYPRLKKIYDDTIAEMEHVLGNSMEYITCPDSIDEIDDSMTRELLETEPSEWKNVLPKYYHKRTKQQLAKHLMLFLRYKRKHNFIPTSIEQKLWGNDLAKIERVRLAIQYFDELNPKGNQDKETGNFKLKGSSVAKLMHWALRGTDAKMNDFVGYFNETYKGKYQKIEYATVWTAYSGLKANEKDKCVFEIENFLNKKGKTVKKFA